MDPYISYQITAAAAAMHYERGGGFEKEDEVPFSVTNSSNSISARLFEASGRIQFRGLEGNSRVIEYDYLYLINCRLQGTRLLVNYTTEIAFLFLRKVMTDCTSKHYRNYSIWMYIFRHHFE